MIRMYGTTDRGKVRTMNQDSLFYGTNANQESIMIVCDGIGGGNAGDVASFMAKEVLAKEFENKEISKTINQTKEWLRYAIEKANDEVFRASTTNVDYKGMGTTVAGVLFSQNETFIFHCGDSRVYAMYDGELIALTEDHNLASDLVQAGEVSVSQASSHPKGSMLTRALGVWNKVDPSINKIKNNYQSIMVSSDGLHGFVSAALIQSILQQEISIEDKVHELILASNETGGYDNVTIIVAEKEGA
ncbi:MULTISPECIES: Stp1/IreP family PP2C-type Ser/Thr phosphatase [unclassified Breznakia]|uniref:Stp1/IreP family PP2C-type Ser/Thr phosphatase n=1 Tax=unclassified Breznakia TaxID=2623764 RepID=UPI0024740227|nr:MULTISPECIES: Stp1/IreP family PP2C-type Ser/Thr phosphatase [unclassified Breznakia]MDH6367078.1 serine/threonine protein phosphatase PrpC [Breznakia sp. PH1-1]MDH6404335.1 serine/threonine protein phosphatase PrpC [Breznakia sp. PF1-11]MDH6411965.1 serine/threonine protein phosphatase PrpC [Breznakia sp. PFB1-11]MDH6414323.1 serine/threonine protein phosphatase PrpC [Breznakia sp. PFB1-14]MDH6416579.1 serine/threonine protein phosphatase PrpC [Breznakia sp. PFB1-4]